MHRSVAVLALMLPVLTWNQGQALVEKYRNWRGRAIAMQAQNLRLAGRADQALSLLVNAFGGSPREPQLIRAIAWASAAAFPNQAKYFLEKLVAAEAASTDDLLLLGSIHVTLKEGREAAAIYQELVREQPRNPDVWRAWAAACHQCGQFSEAMKAYRKVLLYAPHDRQASLGVADLLIRSGVERDQNSAIDLLLAQLERSTVARLPASGELADLLLGLSVVDARQRRELARLLSQVPDPTPEHRVAAIFYAYPPKPGAVDGGRRRERLQAFLADHRGLGLADRAKVSSWLHRHGEHALVLDWTSLAEASGDARLFAERLDALMACGLWREAAEIAAAPGSRDLGANRDLLQTLAILRSCREPRSMAESMLVQALADAGTENRPLARNAIACAALDYGLFEVAAKAFAENIVEGAHSTVCPLNEFLLAARNGGQTASEVGRVLAARARMDRADVDLQKQSLYFQLLCGQEMERAAYQTGALRQASPGDPYLKFLDAFARYRLGDYVGATKALVPLPAHRWHQGETLVIATILASGGRLREAATLAEKVTGKGTFEEERRLLEGWQGKHLVAPDLLSDAAAANSGEALTASASSPGGGFWAPDR